MPKASPIQEALNAGEFSPLTAARVRFEKYKNALSLCENMIPIVQGGVTRRGGTMFVKSIKTASLSTRIVAFEFSTTQAYVLEFGNLYMRVFKDRGNVESAPGVPYEMVTTYATADLFQLKFTQSADVLYVTHPSYKPRKITRTGHAAWTITDIAFLDGPYLNTNTTATTLTLSATSGSVTVTASAAIFSATNTDIGRQIRFKSGGTTWGWMTITAWTSTTVVTATITRSPNAATASVDWRLGVWSTTTGFPACVTFFEDRLFFAGATNYPHRIDGSKSSDYENFAPSGDTGTIADDNAIAVTLNSSDVNVIRWLVDDEKGLLCGTTGGEWLVRPSSLSEAMTPTNITAKRSTTFGSANIQPKRTGKATIYMQRAGRKVRELAYVYESDGFRSPDMTVLSEHVTKGGIIEIEYQQEPFSIVWMPRTDGQLIGMTYERDQDVIGWHRHIIGGAFGSGAAVVESVAVIPTPAGTADELWMIVKRTINGSTARYIEYMTERFDADDSTTAFFVDGGLTYSGIATTSITGLSHLEGSTVQVLADGAAHPDVVVTGGAITLTIASTLVHVGFGFNSNISTLRIEAGSADGTAQGKTKRIHRVAVRLYKTVGMKHGPDASTLDTVTFRKASDDANAPVPLFTGEKSFTWNNGYDTEGVMYFRQDQPLPFTLLAIMPILVTNDR